MGKLSHTDSDGRAQMVDTGDKQPTARKAVASVRIELNETSFALAQKNQSAKGDILAAATLAGIQAAKKTWELIPLCHQIGLDRVAIDYNLNDADSSITAISTVRCVARTGPEMEALTACSMAALTIYDMLKAVQRDISITDLKLLEKEGGKTGVFKRADI